MGKSIPVLEPCITATIHKLMYIWVTCLNSFVPPHRVYFGSYLDWKSRGGPLLPVPPARRPWGRPTFYFALIFVPRVFPNHLRQAQPHSLHNYISLSSINCWFHKIFWFLHFFSLLWASICAFLLLPSLWVKYSAIFSRYYSCKYSWQCSWLFLHLSTYTYCCFSNQSIVPLFLL